MLMQKKTKEFTLYYWDRRLAEAEVVECLELAWDELYELEFDPIFGAWRGVHCEADTDLVHVTWDTMYAGPPLMITVNRATKKVKMDYPPDEFIELEQEEIERLRNLPPKGR